MTVSAHDIAAELRRRLPGLPAVKLQKLLYYCQGHHLAGQGRPLFTESISAWDMGPVVTSLWVEEKQQGPRGADPNVHLGESELNTIGYVLSRYGALSGQDLAHLSHNEKPWVRANTYRQPKGSAPIPNEWLTEYFTGDGAPDVPEVDPADVAALIAGAEERLRDAPGVENTPESIRAWMARG